ncbi:TIGR03435 family protein [Bryocella elongata]|nr:TIGR03435 family protein [Bryocella elongata]
MTFLLLALGAAGSATATAQTAAGGPAAAVASPDFDVSTVKTNNTGSGSIRISVHDDMLRADNVVVKMLLEQGFDIRQDQILGLPHWAEVNHYDITAKVVDMTPEQRKGLNKAERMAMMQKLLVERFGVKTHVETRILPRLDLVIAKDGMKLEEFKAPPPVEGGADKPELEKFDPKRGGSMTGSNNELTGTGVEMAPLINFLSNQTHMPVADKTGLKGKYSFHLKWQREDEGAQSGLHDDSLPTIYSAITEQLGLKLESAKGPVQVLVVDHIDLPEEN